MKEDDMVDLEQFREAVEQWKMLAQVGETVEAMPVAFRKKPEEYTARIAEADRLLSIIDSSGKVASAGPVACELLAEIRNLLSSLPVDCLGSDTDASGQPYPIRDEVIHDITKTLARSAAPVVDDAMVDAAMEASAGGHLVRDCWFSGEKWARELMRAALTAALAQGVESP